jgi:flagellar hook assembly protein FlgD
VPVLFGLLVAATIAAFAHAQRTKHLDPVLDRVRVTKDFTPNGDGRRDVAYVRFRITRPDRADVQIVNRNGRPVRTLVRDRALRTYFYWVFSWDGTNERGRPVRPGAYRLRVHLLNQGRDIVEPFKIHLHRVPPVTPESAP